MASDLWHRAEPESPCIRICAIHPRAQICIGCYRSLEEITKWRDMSPAARAEISAQLADRASLLRKRRRNRRATTPDTPRDVSSPDAPDT